MLFESRPFWLLGRISGQLGIDIYLMNVRFFYNRMLPLSYFRPVGCSPYSRCKFQLWDICWYSGLTGDSACRCYQNSYAALSSEISVDWPGSDIHFQSKAIEQIFVLIVVKALYL